MVRNMSNNKALYDSISNPKRTEVEMVICKNCGSIHEGNDETPCPVCKISNVEISHSFDKFLTSD